MNLPLGIAAAIALCLANCASFVESDDRQKAASLADAPKRLIGGVEPFEYVNDRSTAVISGIEIKGVDFRDGGKIRFILENPNNAEVLPLGLAAAISADGYFLTAAHVVDSSPPHWMIRNSRKTPYAKLRLVWMDKAADLAVMKAAVRSSDHFKRRLTRYEIDEGVFAHGRDAQSSFGKVIKIGRLRETDALAVLHGAPLRTGDSGGALVDATGKLIGVNVGVGWKFGKRSLAVAPDWDTIDGVIRRDRRRKR